MSAELRLVRGHATAEELAAVVALLTARSAAPAAEQPVTPSAWGRPQLRQPLPPPGPGSWRASGLRL